MTGSPSAYTVSGHLKKHWKPLKLLKKYRMPPGVSEDRSEDTLDSSEIPANGAGDQPPEDITADDQSPVEQA